MSSRSSAAVACRHAAQGEKCTWHMHIGMPARGMCLGHVAHPTQHAGGFVQQRCRGPRCEAHARRSPGSPFTSGLRTSNSLFAGLAGGKALPLLQSEERAACVSPGAPAWQYPCAELPAVCVPLLTATHLELMARKGGRFRGDVWAPENTVTTSSSLPFRYRWKCVKHCNTEVAGPVPECWKQQRSA